MTPLERPNVSLLCHRGGFPYGSCITMVDRYTALQK